MPRLLRSLLLAFLATSPSVLSAQADEARAALPDAKSTAMTVTVDAVQRETIVSTVVGTGTVEVWQEATVGSETSGLVLSEVLVSEGERVAKGQILARLDAALHDAQVAEQDAAIRSAEASLADAEAASERAVQLARTGNITAETVQARATTSATASAALDQAKAKRQTLAVQVERATIRAPFAGVVSARPAVVGIVVQVGTEIVRLQRDGVLEAKLKVPEAKLGQIAVGNAATLVAPDGSSVEVAVSAISPTIDTTTHLATVSVRLPPETSLKAGMFVRGMIHRETRDEQLTVSANALTWSGGQAAVFAVAGDTVSRRAVKIGERADDRFVVSGNLQPGEVVATAGVGFLNDGDRVAVVETSAALEGTVR